MAEGVCDGLLAMMLTVSVVGTAAGLLLVGPLMVDCSGEGVLLATG